MEVSPFRVGVQVSLPSASRLWVRRGLNRVSISHTIAEGGGGGGQKVQFWRVDRRLESGAVVAHTFFYSSNEMKCRRKKDTFFAESASAFVCDAPSHTYMNTIKGGPPLCRREKSRTTCAVRQSEALREALALALCALLQGRHVNS